MDLTKIEKPFGLLDDETQAALINHGGEIECYLGKDRWGDCSPYWIDTSTYRVKPQPQRKTVYPWDALDDRIKWAAVDEFERLWVSDVKLEKNIQDWLRGRRDAHEILKFQRGDEPWTETLQCRPGYEGNE